MRIIGIILILVNIIVSCGYLPDSLTQKDIDQYLNAYEKLTNVSTEIENAKTRSNSVSIFTCSECREIMRKAVMEAGYSGLKEFMLVDLRMSYTMRYVAYLKITEIVGDLSEDIPVEDLCNNPQLRKNIDKAQREKVDKHCRQVVVFTSYIENIGSYFKYFAKEMMSKGDIELVAKNFERIHSTLTNKNLIKELNRSNGDWDD